MFDVSLLLVAVTFGVAFVVSKEGCSLEDDESDDGHAGFSHSLLALSYYPMPLCAAVIIVAAATVDSTFVTFLGFRTSGSLGRVHEGHFSQPTARYLFGNEGEIPRLSMIVIVERECAAR